LQPGLLIDQPLRSMRANSFQLVKFCCTWTVTAAETKSIGLQADTRVVMVFAPDSYREPSGQLYRDMTNPTHLSGPRHLDDFIMTKKSCPFTGTLPAFVKTSVFKAKTRHPDADGNSLNRRAVRLNNQSTKQFHDSRKFVTLDLELLQQKKLILI